MKLPLALLALVFAVALRAADSPPLFNAILTVGKEHRFVLLDADGKASSFLNLGDSFGGYKLKAFDAKAGVLELDRDGRTSRVTLMSDAAIASAPAAKIPGTIADATAVLNAMNFEKMMDRTMAGVKKQQAAMMEKMTGQMAGPAADREAVVAFQKKIVDEMMSAMSGADMKDDVAKVYSEIFTKDELQNLAGFFNSPIGQAYADKQPIIAEKMNEVMMPRMMAVMPKVQQMAKDFAAEQKAKKAAAGGAAPAAPANPPAPKP
jgi:uncharacterized protein